MEAHRHGTFRGWCLWTVEETHADMAAVRAGLALTQTGPVELWVEHTCPCEVESWAILQNAQDTRQSGQCYQHALIHWPSVEVA